VIDPKYIWIALVFAMGVGAVLIGMLTYILQRQARDRHYDEERHRAQLDSVRKSFEEQIYRLTDRLLATEERWRDVNHLLISGQTFGTPPERIPNVVRSGLLERAGLQEQETSVDKKLVFMLTPFHPEFENPYIAVKEVCGSIGLKCLRGDEEHVRGDLLRHILSLIAKARLVIANVDGRNPNVFYELGIAHALNKPVLILSSTPDTPPFDIRTTSIIFWDSIPELKSALRNELLKVFVAGQ
jgi:hypothetical protein